MKNIFTKISTTVATGTALSCAITISAFKAEAVSLNPQLIQEDLFFGRNIPGGGEVSNAQFQGFVNDVITPRFPDGLTIFDANGQYKDSTGTIIKEKTKDLTLLFEDTLQNEASINEIVKAYTQQFDQESVLQVADENVDVAFVSQPSPVPEADSIWGLLALGVLGAAASTFKKRHL